MIRPRLSICIPTYNRADLLRETLTHLREVCDDDVEIVVSDNCSPDDTQDVINSFAGRFRYFRAVRQTMNRGALPNCAAVRSLARGKYLYLLHDDDQIHVQGLQTAISIMEECPKMVAVFGRYEEWERSTGQTIPAKPAHQRMDFPQGSNIEIINKFSYLVHPVCRTDVFQRFSSFDRNSFGFWELVGSLIKHGDISVIPDFLYKHAHTEGRSEYELTEGWYHDAVRTDFESFFGRMGQPYAPEALAVWLHKRTTPYYQPAVRFALMKRDFLAARHFVLRCRACGWATKEEVEAWEKGTMVAMLAERLMQKVELRPEIDAVVFEASPRLKALREQFAAVAPQYSLTEISEEAFRQRGLGTNQLFVTVNYGSFESGAATGSEPTLSIALADLVETCRLTDQPLGL